MYIDLAGEWEIWLKELNPEREPDGQVSLPGILQSQGFGTPISRDTPWVSGLHDPFWYEREEYSFGQEEGVQVPFLAQPPLHYVGKAWYKRAFSVGGNGGSEDLFLRVELTHWHCAVWVDGNFKGEDCSLCTAHQINLGKVPEGSHTITVCIDNRFQYPYRPDGHEVSDALGASWNGMAGEIAVLSEGELQRRQEERLCYAKKHPRVMEVKDGRFYVDGRAEYFRGTHFGGDFPLTGYPETDISWWKNLMKTVKEWGLNFIRCHSYCPPEAAFEAADEAGIYIQAECGMWNVFNEETPMLSVLKTETERILDQFGHHPSFVLLSPSNEPSGQWYGPLKQWVEETREYDSGLGYGKRRLYTAQSGWFYDMPPEGITGTDYIYFHRSAYGPIFGGNIRGPEGWKGKDYCASLEGANLPVICHEMGQWCAYPDFSVTEKFTGYLRPGNYRVFKENARARGLLGLNSVFVKNSGKTQVMMYKEDMEANFRTPQIYGFEMLDLHDYLGQGTALVGVLDPFWESKGYIKPEEFKEFCGETVILARISSYVCTAGEHISIPVEVCHFGKEPIEGGKMEWELRGEEDGETGLVESGVWTDLFLPLGKNIEVGRIEPDFSLITGNRKMTLTVRLGDVKNHWDIYVYRKRSEIISCGSGRGVLYTRTWPEAKKALSEGKRVVYSPFLSELDFDCPPLSMNPVFWNSQMGPDWMRCLGLVIEKEHPVFKSFPTEEYGGWQWEDILNQSRGFLLKDMPGELKPVVRAIDDWNRNLPLGLIFEGRVGDGRLLVVSACLEGEFEKRPAAWSLKKAILNYAASDEFCPETELCAEMIEKRLFPNNRMRKLGAQYKPENQPDGGLSVKNLHALYEENPDTSVWIEQENYPISVDIHFPEKISASGLLLVPDQKDRMHEGCVKDYVISVCTGGKWQEAARGTFQSSFLTQAAHFACTYETDAIRFTALSGYGSGERPVWKEQWDGWHKVQQPGRAVFQAAGLHVINGLRPDGNDIVYWKKLRTAAKKEIEE